MIVKFKKFKIIEVLDWQSQKEIDPLKIKKLTVDSNQKYPFYGQATINNGIIDYIKGLCEYENIGNNCNSCTSRYE